MMHSTGWPLKFKSQIPGVFRMIFKKIPGEIKPVLHKFPDIFIQTEKDKSIKTIE